MKIKVSKQGFSITELMVSMGIFVFIMGGLYTTLLAGNASWESHEVAVRSQRSARNAMAQLSKDLRVSAISNLAQQVDDVSFNLAHPVDGNVSYTWDTTGNDANQIIRTSPTGIRIIAQEISAFTINETTRDITLNVIASAQTPHGNTSDFQLIKKIAKRGGPSAPENPEPPDPDPDPPCIIPFCDPTLPPIPI